MGRSISDRDAKCLRCGAPANPELEGGRLRELGGFRYRARVGAPRGRRRDNRRRVPYGYVHEDLAFCGRRMPNARRRPQDRELWGGIA